MGSNIVVNIHNIGLAVFAIRIEILFLKLFINLEIKSWIISNDNNDNVEIDKGTELFSLKTSSIHIAIPFTIKRQIFREMAVSLNLDNNPAIIPEKKFPDFASSLIILISEENSDLSTMDMQVDIRIDSTIYTKGVISLKFNSFS